MKLSDKTKPVPWDLLPLAVVLLLAAGLAVWFWGGLSSGGTTAVVSVGTEEVQRIDLRSLQEPMTLTLDDLPYPVTVTLWNDGVEVTQSQCPGQDCMHSGKIQRSGESIVCLPNRLMIRLEGGKSAVDAVVG